MKLAQPIEPRGRIGIADLIGLILGIAAMLSLIIPMLYLLFRALKG